MGEDSSFIFRPMKKEDCALILKWLNRPHVEKWWRETDSENVLSQKYAGYAVSKAIHPFIIHVGDKPIGYIQYYNVETANDGWWCRDGGQDPDKGTVGVDIFIGELDFVGKGNGTKLLNQFVLKLFDELNFKKIILDPHPENAAAIKCYGKVGFKGVKNIETPDGPAWLMELYRN